MKQLGVIGGLGPLATAYFYELVIKMTDAASDQEHIGVLIYSKPSIPDRTAYILGDSRNNPLYPLIEAGQRLAGMGADYIAIPCITAHYFYQPLSENISIPIIHAIRETARFLKNAGVVCTGIMATEGTIRCGLLQKELKEYGIYSVIPSEVNQTSISDLIYGKLKAGKPINREKFQQISEELRQRGAEVILLGCTELSMIKKNYKIGPGYLDMLEVLAARSVIDSGAGLRKKFCELITK